MSHRQIDLKGTKDMGHLIKLICVPLIFMAAAIPATAQNFRPGPAVKQTGYTLIPRRHIAQRAGQSPRI